MVKRNLLSALLLALSLPESALAFSSPKVTLPSRTTTTKLANLPFHVFRRSCRDVSLVSLRFAANSEGDNPPPATVKSSDIPFDVAAPLALILFSQFILFIGVGAIIPAIPLYGKSIGLSSAANGVVISAPAVALLIGANAGGKFSDLARRPAMKWGMLLIAISDLGTACAQDLPQLVFARLGLGAGRCMSEAGERGMLADLAGRIPVLRGRILAAQQAAVALGIAIGAPLGGKVVEEYGPRASFLCVTAAALVALVLYSFLPETALDPSRKTSAVNGLENSTKGDGMAKAKAVNNRKDALTLSQKGDWSKLLADHRWQALALCQCGASFGFAAKISSIPILAASALPGGAVGAGALISAAGLSGLVGAPVGGWLTDRAGAKTVVVLSGVVSAVGLIMIPLALGSSELPEVYLLGNDMTGAAAAFAALVIAWSLGASAQGPALTALAQQLAPVGAEATAMALPRAAGDGTYIIAPFALGLVTDQAIGMPGAECAAAGLASLLGTLALAWLGDDISSEKNPKKEQ